MMRLNLKTNRVLLTIFARARCGGLQYVYSVSQKNPPEGS